MNADAGHLRGYLTPQFEYDLNNRTPQDIILAYGTHIIRDFYSGGKLYILYRAQSSSSERIDASRSGIKVSTSLVFDFDVEHATETETRHYNESSRKELYYETSGGNASIGLDKGTIDLSRPSSKILTKPWQNSITYENSEIVDFAQNGLIPIYELVSDPVRRQRLELFVKIYLALRQTKNVDETLPVYSFRHATRGAGLASQSNYQYVIDLSKALQTPFTSNEGIAFKAFDYKAKNTVPVYSYVSTNNFNHLLTINPRSENLAGYRYDGIAFFAYPNPAASVPNVSTAVARYFNKNTIDHRFVADLIIIPGYQYEGIKFYAPEF